MDFFFIAEASTNNSVEAPPSVVAMEAVGDGAIHSPRFLFRLPCYRHPVILTAFAE
jgi:hypothetical protein